MINVFKLKNNNRLQKKDSYFKYSLDEQFTGEYWIDRKKIYKKTIFIESNNIPHGVNMDRVISISAIYNRGNTYGQSDASNDITIQSSNIYLTGNVSTYASSGVYITIKYTHK